MKSVSQAKIPDYYELLDVDASASHDQIRVAYRRLARQLHPDAGGNAGLLRLLREAFETLSDPAARSTARQLTWLRTRMKEAALQALLVAT